MLNLTKEEKTVLVFLAGCLVVGTGVSYWRKEIASSPRAVAGAPRNDSREIVNINTADFHELMKLKGVGPKTAIDIIDYRRANGPFFYKDDITKIKGIGNARFTLIKDDICLE